MKTTRRKFVRLAAGALAVANAGSLRADKLQNAATVPSPNLKFQSRYFRVELSPNQPNFVALAVDSLGKGELDADVMLPLPHATLQYQVSRRGDLIEYRRNPRDEKAAWSFEFSEKAIVIRATAPADNVAEPVALNFDPSATHSTLMGRVTDEGNILLPGILHFPAHGSFRVTSTMKDAVVAYDASRDHGDNFVRVSLPPTTWTWHREVEYRFEVAAIYPNVPAIDGDPRYDGFRRDFLSIFQINPRRRALANNSASDATPITLFEYSMMAEPLPSLAPGLTAWDLVRQTLDRYIGGMTGYGMTGYLLPPRVAYDFLDVYPPLVMAAVDYVNGTDDKAWLERNYSVIRTWADKMIEFDRDDDGLMEYALSGNSGSWPIELSVRPSNWWDTIGFGHKDAYANALAYHAYIGMEKLAATIGDENQSERYRERAKKLKAVYYQTFFNPATGILAGWKSADGKLHDYYFLFVNGVAVTFGLVTPEQGRAIWDKLLAKMNEVGYRRFDLGLPGNLIPIRREDYVDLNPRYGGPQKADGSDGFQTFENGGASACFAYFTIQALRIVGLNREADAILFPMLESFRRGGFQGRGANGETFDWTDWQGKPNGYEGLLVDNYLTLLAAAPSAQVPG